MNFEQNFTSFSWDDKNPKNTGQFRHIRPLSESIDNLQYWFSSLNEEIQRVSDENARLKDEHYKDEELQAMKTKMEEAIAKKDEIWHDCLRGFPISESEQEQINNWMKKHDTEEHKNPKQYHGCSGGDFSYEFYPTAIGTSGVIICDCCRRRAYDAAYAKGSYDRDAYQTYMKEHNGEFEFQELG